MGGKSVTTAAIGHCNSARSTGILNHVDPVLSDVDQFIANVRPWIFVREEDRLLIKRPNEAQKLNRQGVAILQALLDGDPTTLRANRTRTLDLFTACRERMAPDGVLVVPKARAQDVKQAVTRLRERDATQL